MTVAVPWIFCTTHDCDISVTGCMKRQHRHQHKDRGSEWRASRVPKDPKCADCAQGKKIMKQYHQLRKEETMTETQAPYQVSAEKKCTRCSIAVDRAEAAAHFYRSKTTRDGFEPICKQCKSEMAKELRAKRANQQGKPVSSKSKPEKNPEKKAAASPETPVEKVVTPDIKAWIRASVVNAKKDTIQKNNHPVDPDEMVKEGKALPPGVLDLMVWEVFEQAGYRNLYDELKKSAFRNMRPPHLQALFLVTRALMKEAAGDSVGSSSK